jgi:hypothetical protein
MSGQGDEVFCPGPLVQLDKRIGVPPLGLPKMTDVFVSELRWVPVLLDVKLILARTL